MHDIYEEIVKARQEGTSIVLATIVKTTGSTPAGAGAKMIVKDDGSAAGTIGGGCIDAAVKTEAIKALATGKSATVNISLNGDEIVERKEVGLICGGEVEVFLEPILSPTLYLFGAGHVSATTSKIAKLVGFRVVVFDDRQEYANKERFPHADEIVVGSFDELRDFRTNKDAYIAIVTRGHKYDETVLAWAVGQEAKYIGMIGSRTKIAATFQSLEKKGVDRSRLERVHSPIGIDIAAKTTDEIAVSIVAQLIVTRRRSG